MDAISRNIQILLSVIKRSDTYLEYKKQEAILMQTPELMERVDQFRANNFHLQNETARENLLEMTDLLSQESKELRRIPEVNAYLDAELALCKLMQRVVGAVADGIDIHIPEF